VEKTEIEAFIKIAALLVIDDLNLVQLTGALLKQQIAFSVYRSLSMSTRKFPVVGFMKLLINTLLSPSHVLSCRKGTRLPTSCNR